MINYEIIHKSIEFYEDFGFKRIESPWTVSRYVDDLTKPKEKTPFELKHNDKRLVGSGEQSFLYLYLKGFLPSGKYQTVTPCFRFDEFDSLHTKYFIKNELIQTVDVNVTNLKSIANRCHLFFQSFFNEELDITQTDDGFEISIEGCELGSYGIRKCDYLKWIYATGCAEPRLSTLIERFNKY